MGLREADILAFEELRAHDGARSGRRCDPRIPPPGEDLCRTKGSREVGQGLDGHRAPGTAEYRRRRGALLPRPGHTDLLGHGHRPASFRSSLRAPTTARASPLNCVGHGDATRGRGSFARRTSTELANVRAPAPPHLDPFPIDPKDWPRVHIPYRDDLHYEQSPPTSFGKAMELLEGHSPSLWWPSDRAWCAATEIDVD